MLLAILSPLADLTFLIFFCLGLFCLYVYMCVCHVLAVESRRAAIGVLGMEARSSGRTMSTLSHPPTPI